MANHCGITFHIWFETKLDFDNFKNDFEQVIDETQKQNKGLKIADDVRHLFEVYTDYDENNYVASLYGWTKWTLEKDDVVAWFKELCKKYKIVSSEIFYEEMSSLLYGEYILENNVLINRYVDTKDFPQYNDENYYEILEDILRSDKAIKEIIER